MKFTDIWYAKKKKKKKWKKTITQDNIYFRDSAIFLRSQNCNYFTIFKGKKNIKYDSTVSLSQNNTSNPNLKSWYLYLAPTGPNLHSID